MHTAHRGLALCLIALSTLMMSHCKGKEDKQRQSRQSVAVQAIESVQQRWKKSSSAKRGQYFYRVDASPYVEGNSPAQLVVAVEDDQVVCRRLITERGGWIETGADINSNTDYPLASTVTKGLSDCLEYAEEQYTDNFEFEHKLRSNGELETFGCYYVNKPKSKRPIMVVDPRDIFLFDLGSCAP